MRHRVLVLQLLFIGINLLIGRSLHLLSVHVLRRLCRIIVYLELLSKRLGVTIKQVLLVVVTRLDGLAIIVVEQLNRLLLGRSDYLLIMTSQI